VLFNGFVGVGDLGSSADNRWNGLDGFNSSGSGEDDWALLNGLSSGADNNGVLDGLDSAGINNWVLDGLDSIGGVGQWDVVVDELSLSKGVDVLDTVDELGLSIDELSVHELGLSVDELSVHELSLSEGADDLLAVGVDNWGVDTLGGVDEVGWAGSGNSQDGQKNNLVHDEELLNKQA